MILKRHKITQKGQNDCEETKMTKSHTMVGKTYKITTKTCNTINIKTYNDKKKRHKMNVKRQTGSKEM